MNIDFHYTIQPQPSTTNIEYRDDQSQESLLWSDEDCDYIFESVSSAVVSCETASSPVVLSNSKE